MEKIISVKDLSVKYDSGYAVRDISFNVYAGDYLCIVGENGSGKSTLMKVVLGLLKPTGGSVQFYGLKQNQIGFIPQQTVVQKDFPTSVFEVVLSGNMSRHGLMPFYSRKDKQLARDKIKLLGAEPFIHKSYCDLSGGQQQRVLLARALCATEKVLLLDEPVTGLDPVMAGELYGILNGLNRAGTAIVMISHDVASSVRYAKKILHMQTGSLFYGKTAEYVRSPVYGRMMGGNANV